MQDKMATLRRLMNEGYELEEIDSERGVLLATFHRGGHRATLRLFPSDAERLLYHVPRTALVRVRR